MREREAEIEQEVKMRTHFKDEQLWQKGREKRVGDWRHFKKDPKKRRVRTVCRLWTARGSVKHETHHGVCAAHSKRSKGDSTRGGSGVWKETPHPSSTCRDGIYLQGRHLQAAVAIVSLYTTSLLVLFNA